LLNSAKDSTLKIIKKLHTIIIILLNFKFTSKHNTLK
jgi:hypothetical protein